MNFWPFISVVCCLLVLVIVLVKLDRRRPERYRVVRVHSHGKHGPTDTYSVEARGWFFWWELNHEGKEVAYGSRTNHRPHAIEWIEKHREERMRRKDNPKVTEEYIS